MFPSVLEALGVTGRGSIVPAPGLTTLAAMVFLFGLGGEAGAAPPPACYDNEACGIGSYCECHRRRSRATGDCDELGGRCALLGGDPRINDRMLELWRARKRHYRERFDLAPHGAVSHDEP